MKKTGLILVVLLVCGVLAVVWWNTMREAPDARAPETAAVATEGSIAEAPAPATAPGSGNYLPDTPNPDGQDAPKAAPAVVNEPAPATPAEVPTGQRRERPRAPSGELKMTRRAPAGGYIPGAPLDIEVGLEYQPEAFPITALAVVEELPEGWTYDGIAGGPKPTIAPAVGASGPLQFVWVEIPQFPAAFAYRVRVPGGETGVRTLSGQSLYRTDGPEAQTPGVATEIPALTP